MGQRSSYLTLDPEIERAIQADRAAGRAHPCAFDDRNVTRRTRNPHDDATLARPAFARHRKKIENHRPTPATRGKTQVFSFVENDDICRRGLHVQLVSRVARSIGSLLGAERAAIEAIALGHDVGHTPFGHAGERFLNKIYHTRTGKFFNHNVHPVRVLDELYRSVSLKRSTAFCATTGEFCCQKARPLPTSTFEQLDRLVEICNEDESRIKTLRPSTLEGCVVRVSDMIAIGKKIGKDAYDMGVIDLRRVRRRRPEPPRLQRADHQQPHRRHRQQTVMRNRFPDRWLLSRRDLRGSRARKRQNYVSLSTIGRDDRRRAQHRRGNVSGHVRTTARDLQIGRE